MICGFSAFDDFDVIRSGGGRLNLLEQGSTRNGYCPEAPFVHMSTQ